MAHRHFCGYHSSQCTLINPLAHSRIESLTHILPAVMKEKQDQHKGYTGKDHLETSTVLTISQLGTNATNDTEMSRPYQLVVESSREWGSVNNWVVMLKVL